MPTFKYEVRTSSGEVTSGIVQAQNMNEATLLARNEGGYLLNVKPLEGAAGAYERMRAVNVEFGPGLRDILSFTTQLSVMIKAGINIRNALGSIAEQQKNQKFKRILMQIKSDVEGGKTFSEALSRHPKAFPSLYVNMIRASELSGNLGHMLDRIVAHLTQQCETRAMVIGAMVYPAIIGTLAIGTTIFMLTWVLPRFTALFEGKEDLLPTPTIMLMSMSDYLRNYWYTLVGGLVAAIVGFKYWTTTSSGHYYWDKAKLRIPLFKRMLRALYISRGLHTMGELVNAGVPMLETLKITSDVSGNEVHRRMWTTVHDSVKQGQKIADPLSKQSLLPRNVVQMISAGEESGNLGEVLRDVAEFYQKELQATIKAVTAMIEPLMIVVMGAVVGFIAMSIMLPIFKMSNVVQ
jgi:type IV pilus assembly protein PilC